MSMNAVGHGRPAPAQEAQGSVLLSPKAVIARNIAIKLLSELAARALQFAFIIVAARRLGSGNFGLYSFAAALGFVLAQFSDLGLHLYAARELARAPDRRPQILGAALRCKFVLFALSFLFLTGYVRVQAGALERDVLFLLALAVLMTSPLEFFNYAFRGYQRLEFEAGLNLTARLLGPGAATVALFFGASLRVVAWNLLLANVTAAVLGYYWLTRHFVRPDWRVSRAEWWYALAQVLPLGIAILLSALYTRQGILFLTRAVSLDAAGWFNAAQRLTEPLQLLPAIALSAVFPAFAAQHDARMQAGYARRTLLALLALAVPAAAMGWLGAGLIIDTLYGPEFRSSAAVLRWLALAVPPAFLNYALTHFIIARGRAWFNALFNSIILIENVSLNFWLVPRFGAQGAAISLLVSEITLFVLCVFGYRTAMRAAPCEAALVPFGPYDSEDV